MTNPLSMNEYDKVVRRFVDDYVNNLTPDQMREIMLPLQEGSSKRQLKHLTIKNSRIL